MVSVLMPLDIESQELGFQSGEIVKWRLVIEFGRKSIVFGVAKTNRESADDFSHSQNSGG